MGLLNGLFGSASPPREPPIRPTRTLEGGRQGHPEDYGSWSRRQRLYHHAAARLDREPAAEGYGELLGDGTGMEELVARIAPMFAGERALLKWVAARGAVADLWACGPDVWNAIPEAIGLVWHDHGPAGEGRFAPAPEHRDLSATLIDNAVGVQASIMRRVVAYEQLRDRTIDDVLEDRTAVMNDAIALDCIAWAAIVTARLSRRGILPTPTATPPVPSALEGPGWYVDPMFAKADRYYDGADWTARCRPASPGERGEWTQRL